MSINVSKLHAGLLVITCSLLLAFHTVVTPDFDLSLQNIRPIVRELQEVEEFNTVPEFNTIGIKERKGVQVRQPDV